MKLLQSLTKIGSLVFALLVLVSLSAQVESKMFTINKIYPFTEMNKADEHGQISLDNLRFKPENWRMITLKFPQSLGVVKYQMFLQLRPETYQIMVKEMNTEKSNNIIMNDDLMNYCSPYIPLNIYFLSSTKHNPIFDMNIKGLIEIEKALNEHLSDHPIEITQDINMIRYIETDLTFKNMGYIYTTNKELLNEIQTNYDDYSKFKAGDFFDISMDPGITSIQIINVSTRFRKKLGNLFNEFIIALLPNKTLDDLKNPTTEKIKVYKKLHEDFMEFLEDVSPKDSVTFLQKIHFTKNILRIKKIINLGLKKYVLDFNSNFLLNPFMFKSPEYYFPGKVQISMDEFISVYTKELVKNLLPNTEMEIIEGDFVFNLNDIFVTKAKSYRDALESTADQFTDIFPDKFEKSLFEFVRNINTFKFLVPVMVESEIAEGIMHYLNAMYINKTLKQSNIFKEGSDNINIEKLNLAYNYFGFGGNVDNGYQLKVEVFKIKKNDDTEKNTRE